MRVRLLIVASVLALVVPACGGEPGGSDEPSDPGAPATEAPGDDGGSDATMTVSGITWDFDSLVCGVGVDQLDVLVIPGLGESGDTIVTIKVIGDWSGDSGGQIESIDITLLQGDVVNPIEAWNSTLDAGGASVSVDGRQVRAEGRFDDLKTETVEAEEGAFEGECPEQLVEPEVVTTTIPAYEAQGTVVVGGETFVFTYDAPGGICGQDARDGKFASRGVLVDNPDGQVVFTYGLAGSTPDGNPVMQVAIYDSPGNELWYSSVGYAGGDVGSIETLAREGNTVTATGTLRRSGSDPEEFVGFTAEATCNQ